MIFVVVQRRKATTWARKAKEEKVDNETLRLVRPLWDREFLSETLNFCDISFFACFCHGKIGLEMKCFPLIPFLVWDLTNHREHTLGKQTNERWRSRSTRSKRSWSTCPRIARSGSPSRSWSRSWASPPTCAWSSSPTQRSQFCSRPRHRRQQALHHRHQRPQPQRKQPHQLYRHRPWRAATQQTTCSWRGTSRCASGPASPGRPQNERLRTTSLSGKRSLSGRRKRCQQRRRQRPGITDILWVHLHIFYNNPAKKGLEVGVMCACCRKDGKVRPSSKELLAKETAAVDTLKKKLE